MKFTTLEELLQVAKLRPLPELSNADFVICSDTSNFTDDVHGKCDLCNTDIVWRAYWNNKLAKRVCIKCAIIEVGRKGELQPTR